MVYLVYLVYLPTRQRKKKGKSLVGWKHTRDTPHTPTIAILTRQSPHKVSWWMMTASQSASDESDVATIRRELARLRRRAMFARLTEEEQARQSRLQAELQVTQEASLGVRQGTLV